MTERTQVDVSAVGCLVWFAVIVVVVVVAATLPEFVHWLERLLRGNP